MGWFDDLATVVLTPVVAPFAVATVLYDEITNSSSSSDDYEDDYEERREELQREEKRSRRREVESEIQSFKENSKRQIKNKYGVDISYSNSNVKISNSKKGNIKDLEDHISKVRAENKNIENLIKDLQRAKNEI